MILTGRPIRNFTILEDLSHMKEKSFIEDAGKKGERVESIIRSACAIMGRNGFVNVSLSDIAEEAGVSKALLHYYFKNKDELVGDIYKYAMSEYLETAVSIFAEEAPLEKRIERLFDAFYIYIQKNPDWFVVVMELTLLGIKNPERTRDVFSRHVYIRDLTAGVLKRARDEENLSPDVDLDVMASLMVAMANGFAMSYLIAQDVTDFPRFMTYFRKMIMDFMRNGIEEASDSDGRRP
jgi:TetR/AcrR family fatty acid metabolism transcriptional regulator